jgi:ComF family protein
MGLSGFGDQQKRFPLLNSTIAAAANAAMAMAFAPACAACASVLDEPLAGPICGACWSSIPAFTAPWRAEPAGSLSAVSAAAPFDGALRNIIHAWKFEGRQRLARPLAGIVRDRCAGVIEGAEIAVPVPMAPWRKWRRGFNQAEDLARLLGLPVSSALVRWKIRRAQSTLPLSRRLELDSSIRVSRRHRPDVDGRVVLLVDDVVTTGATLEACGRAVRNAGAADVRAVTVARTMLRP